MNYLDFETYKLVRLRNAREGQMIPGNDQNTIPANQLPEVNSIGQVSWRFMALGSIQKAFQVIILV